jgi:hypothetical protein
MESIESIKQQISALQDKLQILEAKNSGKTFDQNLTELRGAITTRKTQIEKNDYSKACIVAKFIDRDMIPPLQVIFDMLKDLDERVYMLENT